MRVGELSNRSGVPVATIKFYVREGLLPPGDRTGPNQSDYGEPHLHRLRLVRALIDVGGLPVATVRAILAQVDAPEATLHLQLGKVQYALTAPRPATDDELAEVDAFLTRRDWTVRPSSPARSALAEVLGVMRTLGQDDLPVVVDRYADAVRPLAEAEVAALAARETVDAAVEGVVIGTVLGDRLLSALRRLAEEDVSTRLLNGGTPVVR